LPQDQEDGTVEIELSFLQHQAPHSWGFLFVGGWVDLCMVRYISLILFTGLAWGQARNQPKQTGEYAELKIITIPDNANAILDSTNLHREVTPLVFKDVQVGSHGIMIIKDDYYAIIEDIEVFAGQNNELTYTLELNKEIPRLKGEIRQLKLYRNLSSLVLSMSIIGAGASIRSAADDQYIEWKSASGEVASDLRNQVESKDLISTTLFSVGGFSVVIPYYIFEKKIQFLESELYNWENFIYVKK